MQPRPFEEWIEKEHIGSLIDLGVTFVNRYQTLTKAKYDLQGGEDV